MVKKNKNIIKKKYICPICNKKILQRSSKKHEKIHNKKEFCIYEDCVVSNIPQQDVLFEINKTIERLINYRDNLFQKKFIFDKDIHTYKQPNYKFKCSEKKEKPITLKIGVDKEEKECKNDAKNNYFNINNIHDFNN